jgi:hypothetical protein
MNTRPCIDRTLFFPGFFHIFSPMFFHNRAVARWLVIGEFSLSPALSPATCSHTNTQPQWHSVSATRYFAFALTFTLGLLQLMTTWLLGMLFVCEKAHTLWIGTFLLPVAGVWARTSLPVVCMQFRKSMHNIILLLSCSPVGTYEFIRRPQLPLSRKHISTRVRPTQGRQTDSWTIKATKYLYSS